MNAVAILRALSILEAALNAGADLAPVLQKLASKQAITMQELSNAVAQTDTDLAAEQKEVSAAQ